VRKFAKIAIIACLSAAAVLAVLFGSLSLWFWYKTAQVESLYQGHRLLSEMRAIQKSGTNDSALSREALLRVLPLGTNRETAVVMLRREGLGCQTISEPITDTGLRRRFVEARGLTNIPNDSRSKRDFVDCQSLTPSVLGYTQWIVDLEFDANGHLSDAGVAIWNIFL
jgi:hypothetical protein